MKTLKSFPADRLAEVVGRFTSLKVAVVGDFFLDKYLEVDPALAEVSVETGKVAHQVVRVRHSPGAAGTVTNNLAALECGRLWAIGIIGDDGGVPSKDIPESIRHSRRRVVRIRILREGQ
jgi:bifunctional ADP-heptose synthase (sugar kinase/adenylyltransferase)